MLTLPLTAVGLYEGRTPWTRHIPQRRRWLAVTNAVACLKRGFHPMQRTQRIATNARK